MSKIKTIIATIPTPTRNVKIGAFILWTLAILLSGWWMRGVYEDAKKTKELRTTIKHERASASASADATNAGQAQAAKAEAQNEGETSEAKQRIDRIYIRVPVPADCVQPVGVRDEFAAAQERANRSVRAAAAASGADVP